jgi:hypothetical protein
LVWLKVYECSGTSSKGDYGTMIPEEEIQSNIKEMGYITATPRAIYPSYYKLNDSTVLKVVVNVNYLLPDPRQPEGYSVNASNIFSAFVPKEKGGHKPSDHITQPS